MQIDQLSSLLNSSLDFLPADICRGERPSHLLQYRHIPVNLPGGKILYRNRLDY